MAAVAATLAHTRLQHCLDRTPVWLRIASRAVDSAVSAIAAPAPQSLRASHPARAQDAGQCDRDDSLRKLPRQPPFEPGSKPPERHASIDGAVAAAMAVHCASAGSGGSIYNDVEARPGGMLTARSAALFLLSASLGLIVRVLSGSPYPSGSHAAFRAFSTASGARSITLRNACAVRSICLRPCSQSRSVAALRPNFFAKAS